MALCPFPVLPLVLLVLLHACAGTLVASGCTGDSPKGSIGAMCCPGKNNTCKADGARLNNLRSRTCFCDESCIEIGDCCTDYATACPVIDCQLTDVWSEWGECSSPCGPGYKTKSREILVQPANGGRACDVTTEKMYCEGEKCKVPRAHQGFELTKERARIIPAKFGQWRKSKKYNPYEDIRKNLFEHYAADQSLDRPSYCAIFEVTDVHSACQKSEIVWTTVLKRGSTLCVECQPFSMKSDLGGRCMGHGLLNKVTPWKATTIPGCHGRWTLIKAHQDNCECDPALDNNFVFV